MEFFSIAKLLVRHLRLELNERREKEKEREKGRERQTKSVYKEFSVFLALVQNLIFFNLCYFYNHGRLLSTSFTIGSETLFETELLLDTNISGFR